MSSGRTGTRLSSRPVAARIAAPLAGVLIVWTALTDGAAASVRLACGTAVSVIGIGLFGFALADLCVHGLRP